MSIQSVLDALRDEYASELDADIGALLSQLESGDGRAFETAHRLAGTSGTYGFHDVARVARAIEDSLDATGQAAPADVSALRALRPRRDV